LPPVFDLPARVYSLSSNSQFIMIGFSMEYEKHKHLIQPKEYHPGLLIDFLKTNYNWEDITSEYKDTVHFKVLTDSLSNYYNVGTSSKNPVFLKIKNDEKSAELYAYKGFDGINDSDDVNYYFVFLDAESGFFDTNSVVLRYKLTLEKGVTQEEYDTNALALLDALSFIDDYIRVTTRDKMR
jgi:hypothetical protein